MDPKERQELLEIIHDATWSANQGWDEPYDRHAKWGLFEWAVMGTLGYFALQTMIKDGVF